MKRLEYDYPLLNKLEPEDITYKDVPYLRTDCYTAVPHGGDTLLFLEFPPMQGLRELELNFVQGSLQHRFKLSKQSVACQRIEFQGLGLPLALADKHPLLLRPSMFLQVVRFGFGHIKTPELRELLYRGCRYRTKKLYWTVNKGQVMETEAETRRITKIPDMRQRLESPFVHSYFDDDSLHQYIEHFPKWVRVDPIVYNASEKCRKVTIPREKQDKFEAWCVKFGIKRKTPWETDLYKGPLIKSAHDQRDEFIEVLKKYNIAYTLR